MGSSLFMAGKDLPLDRSVLTEISIHPKWAGLGIDEINRRVKRALWGDQEEMREEFDLLANEHSPVWYRGFVELSEQKICKTLEKSLKLLNGKMMVVGHTPQFNGKILGRCKSSIGMPQLFVIDVGISSAYISGCAALEILISDDRMHIRALYPNGKVVEY